MRWTLLIGSLSILYLLAIRILPVAMARANAGHYKDEGIRSLRQIGLMLFLFDEKYGRFPGERRYQTAAVALSQIRFLQGDTESARAVLREGIEAARRRNDFDPWVPFLITQTPDGERILAELRRAVRP